LGTGSLAIFSLRCLRGGVVLIKLVSISPCNLPQDQIVLKCFKLNSTPFRKLNAEVAQLGTEREHALEYFTCGGEESYEIETFRSETTTFNAFLAMPQTTIKSDGFQYGWTITYVLVVRNILLVFLPRVSLKGGAHRQACHHSCLSRQGPAEILRGRVRFS